jgi:anaerobic dimethyl sulfoxide reductase subunit C (anchor subunit)
MNVHDWALITFTILVQMSVGSMWALGAMHFFASRKYGMQEADRLSDRALLAVVPVIALGFLASLFHLGDPFNAYRAVTNLGTSWLSREIFFGVVFAGLAVVFAFMQWRKIGSFGLRNTIAWLAALAGLALVLSMSMVYMLPSQPAWNSWATPISFFATTFLLGALAMGAAFVANYAYLQRKQTAGMDKQSALLRETLRWIAVAAVVLLGVELTVLPLYLATLAGESAAGLASVQLITGSFGWALALRVILAFVGAGLFAVFLYQNAMSVGKEKVLGNMVYIAFIMVLTAEVLGRFLFYVSSVRIGI